MSGSMVWVEARALRQTGFYRAGKFWASVPTQHELPADAVQRVESEPWLTDVKVLDGPPGEVSQPAPEVVTTVERSKPDAEQLDDDGDTVPDPFPGPSDSEQTELVQARHKKKSRR